MNNLKLHKIDICYKIGDKVANFGGCVCIKDHKSITTYLNQFDCNWNRIGSKCMFNISGAPCLNTRQKGTVANLVPITLTKEFEISFFMKVSPRSNSIKWHSPIFIIIDGELAGHKNAILSYDHSYQKFYSQECHANGKNSWFDLEAHFQCTDCEKYIFVQLERIDNKLILFVDGKSFKPQRESLISTPNFIGDYKIKSIGRDLNCDGLDGIHSLLIKDQGIVKAFYPLQEDIKEDISKIAVSENINIFSGKQDHDCSSRNAENSFVWGDNYSNIGKVIPIEPYTNSPELSMNKIIRNLQENTEEKLQLIRSERNFNDTEIALVKTNEAEPQLCTDCSFETYDHIYTDDHEH